MDTNYIRKDGFSNPATERLFKANWDECRMHALYWAEKHCGLCIHSHLLIESPIDGLWHFCLNEDSKYFLETVHFAFGCERQEPDNGGRFSGSPLIPNPPVEHGRFALELGIEDEDDGRGPQGKDKRRRRTLRPTPTAPLELLPVAFCASTWIPPAATTALART